MERKHILYSILSALLLGLLFQGSPVHAQAGSAAELIAQVNAYRTANGLEAYAVDGSLMSLAQSHSEYQASIQSCTHTRANGSNPGDYGISAENIACGLNLSVQGAVYTQWSDQLHTATMLGPETGLVGAGVATTGNFVYYTLAVKRLSGDFTYDAPVEQNNVSEDNQPVVNQPVLLVDATSTPNEDGSIAHIVKYGDTLIDIATTYGISMADLISMNKLDAANPVIFEKQVLLIRLAFTETPFMTATFTPRPPTRTPLPTRTPRPTRTATVYHTPLPTRTQTSEPLIKIPSIEDLGTARPVMAYTFIGISVLGLLILLITAFLPNRK